MDRAADEALRWRSVRLRATLAPLTVEIMGSTITSTARAEAKRRAHQVAERRARAHHEHEQDVTAVLVGYFEANSRADKIRADAQARAAHRMQVAEQRAELLLAQARETGQALIDQAEKDASDDDALVGEAIRRLRELGESVASVAEMTELTQPVVRAVEREYLNPRESGPRTASGRPGAGPHSRESAGPE